MLKWKATHDIYMYVQFRPTGPRVDAGVSLSIGEAHLEAIN